MSLFLTISPNNFIDVLYVPAQRAPGKMEALLPSRFREERDTPPPLQFSAEAVGTPTAQTNFCKSSQKLTLSSVSYKPLMFIS